MDFIVIVANMPNIVQEELPHTDNAQIAGLITHPQAVQYSIT